MFLPIDRRSFLKQTSAAAAVATLAPELTGSALLGQPKSAPGRLVLPLNRGWRYRDTATADARGRDFDDKSFAIICLPHTNVRLPWHGFSENAFQFISLYRRELKLPPVRVEGGFSSTLRVL